MRILTVVFFLSFFSFNIYSQKYEPDSAMVYTSNGCKLIDYYYGDSLTYTWSGECKSGWIGGTGELTKFKKGEKYSVISANFEEGVPQGIGSYKIIKTNEKYNCTFIDGQMIGQGEYWNDGGDHYKGQIKNFMLHGEGKMTYANGTFFEGTFNKFGIWTGKYVNLQDEVIFIFRGEKVDKLPVVLTYSPKIGEELTEYFDAEWKRCNKKDAVFFRKITYKAPNIPNGKVRDFYINGDIQNEFHALYVDYGDDQMTFHTKSKTVYYYTNGNPSTISRYNHQSRKCGIEYDFYESGELFSECHYGDFGLLEGPYLEFYKNGNLLGYSNYNNGSRFQNSYWQITEDGSWLGIHKLVFEDEMSRFEVEDKCADVFEYAGLLGIKIDDKDCNYYKPSIVKTTHKEPYSIELDVVIDKPHKDNLVGLVFNYVDEDNFSALKLSGNRLYSLVTYNKGAESILVQWSSLNVGSDKEEMNCDVLLSFVSDELIIEINDVELNRIPYKPIEEMTYGLFISGKGLSIVRTIGEVVYFDDEKSKDFLEFAMSEREGKTTETEESDFTGNGSGFLITNDGYIATNYHVIEDVSEINVVFDVDGEQLSYSGEVVHSDKDNDVAIIKVDLSDRKVQLPYVLATKLQEVGSSIFALGYPYADVMGSEIKYTNGAVNARTGLQGDVRFYQVSAQVQPGNSGGPCFNEKGEIIGIVSAMLDDAVYENQNVNYVLKISYLKNLMELLPTKSTEFTPKVSKYGSTQDMIKDYKNFVPIIYTK
jgi:hypothetical protein